MLSNSKVIPTIPVTDLARAKNFYQNVLGFTVMMGDAGGVMFSVGDRGLYIYKRGPSKADHTLAGFQVDDIEKEMTELTQKGVKFEHYDLPGLKTDEKGIATTPPVKAAWFKDPDGNILGLTQLFK
jgi:catechol 2,3-dioxygenase-like lactoylglutathione lyase family enzyme